MIVLIHDDGEFLGLLADTLRKELGPDACLNLREFRAWSTQTRELMTSRHCKLAIIGATAPFELARRQSDPHRATRECLSDVLSAKPDLKFTVLVTQPDAQLTALVKGRNDARMLMVRAAVQWQQDLCVFARDALGVQAAPNDTRSTRTVLRIFMPAGDKGGWILERRGQISIPESGALDLNAGELYFLRNDGMQLASHVGTERMRDQMAAVGSRIYNLIFERPKNARLKKAFNGALAEHGAERLRIVFGLPDEQQKLPVETLKEGGPETRIENWYALRAPIFREYRSKGALEPLFRDLDSRERALNILLVAADPAPDQDGAGALPQIEREVRELCALLQRFPNAFPDALFLSTVIAAAPPDETPENLRLRLKMALADKLRERDWDIVHFAGHSGIEPSLTQAGGEALLTLSARAACHMSFKDFAAKLQAARFVFMSSCQSGNLAFLRRAMEESIPALLGYGWHIPDLEARTMAMAFYRALFTPEMETYQSLSRALIQARAHLSANWNWASPVLFACDDKFGAPIEQLARESARSRRQKSSHDRPRA